MANAGHVYLPTPIIKPEDIDEDTLRYLSKDNFAMWALHRGLKVDGHTLEFDNHKYLLPIYMDSSKEIVWVKAAQLGATVYQLLRIIWFLEQNPNTKAGLYLPNKELADNISKDRLGPMLESCDEIMAMTDPNDKLGLRKIGSSSLYMMYLEGKSSKDSVPLDYLSFDEVRLSSQQSIDQTQERIAHSIHKYKVFMSTCGLPNDTIHKRFMGGTQHTWMSACGFMATYRPFCGSLMVYRHFGHRRYSPRFGSSTTQFGNVRARSTPSEQLQVDIQVCCLPPMKRL